MSHTVARRAPRILLLFLFLIFVGILFDSHRARADKEFRPAAPLRLRLRVANNTLWPGDTTKVIVEFVDRDYRQVPNDATRTIQLSQTNAGPSQSAGSGEITPRKIRVARGTWSAEATFSSKQPGRLFITASTEGLDPAQVLVLVARKKASLFSRLLETVAYAEPNDFGIFPRDVPPTPANDHSQATFFVAFNEPPMVAQRIRITTKPPAKVMYNGQTQQAFLDIRLGESEGVSGPISVVSAVPGNVEVWAMVLPAGTKDHINIGFVPPRPARIVFDPEPETVASYQRSVPVSVQLADEGGFPVAPDRERRIRLSAASDAEFLRFEPESVLVAPSRWSGQAIFHLNDLPLGNEIKLLATSPDDSSLKSGQKNLLIESPIEKVLIDGPHTITRSGGKAELTIHLADKNGKHQTADWNRKIELSSSAGQLSQTELTIPKGARQATVTYTSPDDVGTVKITAGSGGLADTVFELKVITPGYWLVLGALLGGIIGGLVRQIHKDYRLTKILPVWTGDCWELGAVGRISGSVLSGLFLYWTFKLGLSKALGTSMLMMDVDMGTKTVAFFFGGIGGFAGTVVLDRLVAWVLPGTKNQRRKREKVTPRATKLRHP